MLKYVHHLIRLVLQKKANFLNFQIALDFHEKRNASPRRYANRVFNKLAYGCISW